MEQEIELARELYGLKTLRMIQNQLNIDRARAIYLIYKLRKKGYVKTLYKSNKERIYNIDSENVLGGTNYLDILNKYSPIKLARFEIHQIYGRVPKIEEVLIYAVKQRNIRHIIASLSLFRKIKNWSLLYNLAKKEYLVREIAALYDVARLFVSKVRRMPKRFKNKALPKRTDKYKYIVDKFNSNNFQGIEKKWKVYIPLNVADLSEYKGFMT